jgi:hypothetical protein
MLPRRSRPWAAAGMARAVAAATITSTRGFLARKEPMVTQNAGPCARRRLFPGMPGLRPGPRQSRLVHDRLEEPAGPPGVAAQGGGNARCPCQPQDGDDQVAHAGSAPGPLVRGAESSHSEDTPDRTHHTGGEPAAHRQGVLVIAAEPSRRPASIHVAICVLVVPWHLLMFRTGGRIRASASTDTPGAPDACSSHGCRASARQPARRSRGAAVTGRSPAGLRAAGRCSTSPRHEKGGDTASGYPPPVR